MEFGTNVYTDHLFSDTYKDKETGEQVEYTESNQMLSLWFDIDQSDFERPFDEGTQLKWGLGRFTNSFGDAGAFVGLVAEPRIEQYSNAFLGKYETYYSLGGIMTNSYDDMSYMPISVVSVGIRNESGSLSIGSYGFAAVAVINLTIKLAP